MELVLSVSASLKLRAWGCYIIKNIGYENVLTLSDGEDWILKRIKNIDSVNDSLFAYNLLTDICEKYPEKFFKECNISHKGAFYQIIFIRRMIENGDIKLAEEYFLEQTIFNPKNRK